MPTLLRVLLQIRTNIELLGKCPTHDSHFYRDEARMLSRLLITSESFFSEML